MERRYADYSRVTAQSYSVGFWPSVLQVKKAALLELIGRIILFIDSQVEADLANRRGISVPILGYFLNWLTPSPIISDKLPLLKAKAFGTALMGKPNGLGLFVEMGRIYAFWV